MKEVMVIQFRFADVAACETIATDALLRLCRAIRR